MLLLQCIIDSSWPSDWVNLGGGVGGSLETKMPEGGGGALCVTGKTEKHFVYACAVQDMCGPVVFWKGRQLVKQKWLWTTEKGEEMWKNKEKL